eukprot:3861791-Pleurochrysis_carterae.AAC.2
MQHCQISPGVRKWMFRYRRHPERAALQARDALNEDIPLDCWRWLTSAALTASHTLCRPRARKFSQARARATHAPRA